MFDNEDGAFGELDFSEVSIARRLVRGGEGQYLVNRTAVRRTDIVELLADVGLGSAMHSIVGQGKVEQVLASKPEDRRALVEEAAGLGKFKRRRHRAELKLARVGVQVERARDVEEEVRKRLRPLALQATAAERAEKLAVEIVALRARVAELDLADAGRRHAEAEERRDAAALARRGAQSRLEGLLADRTRAEDELSDAAGRREAAVAALYRLQGGSERLALRGESATALCERLEAELALLAPTPAGEASDDAAASSARPRRAAAAARTAAAERDELAEKAALAAERLRALERVLAEQEGLPPAARALAERGATLALAALDVEPGSERAVAAALRARASAVLADDPAAALALLEQAREEGLGSLTVLAGAGSGRARRGVPGRAARGASLRHRAFRHARGLRLRPGAAGALVRRRDRRGGAPRARGQAPRARSRGRRARAQRGRGRRGRRKRPRELARAAAAAYGRIAPDGAPAVHRPRAARSHRRRRRAARLG